MNPEPVEQSELTGIKDDPEPIGETEQEWTLLTPLLFSFGLTSDGSRRHAAGVQMRPLAIFLHDTVDSLYA